MGAAMVSTIATRNGVAALRQRATQVLMRAIPSMGCTKQLDGPRQVGGRDRPVDAARGMVEDAIDDRAQIALIEPSVAVHVAWPGGGWCSRRSANHPRGRSGGRSRRCSAS